MLELTDYLHRRPKALSGGQRQRVAVARALVRDPSLYLLDEPLSNLDAKLRAQMRAEISALHQRVGKTFVYVTHDQVEAMTMATRIVVLNEGRVQQIGTPDEIYARPANTFVARFVGSPPMNLLDVTVSGTTAHITDSSLRLNVPGPHGDGPHVLGLRPENLSIARSGEDNVLTGTSPPSKTWAAKRLWVSGGSHRTKARRSPTTTRRSYTRVCPGPSVSTSAKRCA